MVGVQSTVGCVTNAVAKRAHFADSMTKRRASGKRRAPTLEIPVVARYAVLRMGLLARPPATASLVVDLARIVGAANVSSLDVDRAAYARDAWIRDRIGALAAQLEVAPSAVVWPESPEEVGRILLLAEQVGLPVLPWGGGSGRVGAARPRAGGIVLDLKRMRQIRRFEPEDLRIEAESGIIGTRLEKWLGQRGYTLGHFPGSIGASTLGGWLATRAAGQHCTRYGKIEDMTLGVELVTPGRVRRLMLGPRPPDGPDFNALVLGSEGVLGPITAAQLRIRERPASRQFAAFRFPRLEAGLEAVRRVLRASLRPAAVRLYDPVETWLQPRSGGSGWNLEQLAGIWKRWGADASGGWTEQLGHIARRTTTKAALGSPALLNRLVAALPNECLLILGFEGPASLVAAESRLAAELCKQHDGHDLGPAPAEAWWDHRFDAPFSETRLFESGLFVDTIDTAATWDRVLPLYRAVRRAVARDALVGAHFIHAYPEGCAVELTFVGRADEGAAVARERYDRVWRNALVAIHEAGGTIAHHLGVGELKKDALPREHGPGGMRLLGALKRAFDPSWVSCPGALGLEASPAPRPRRVRRAAGVPDDVAAAVGERNLLRTGPRTLIRPPDESALASVLRVMDANGLSAFTDQTGFRPQSGAIELDLGRFEGIRRLSDHALFVEAEAGVLTGRLEQLLKAHGLTLGPVHPRAWNRTVGAGVSRHLLIRRGIGLGDLNDLCFAVRALLPDGSPVETRAVPRSSTGPGLLRAFVGGHGRLGIITKVVLRVAVRSEFSREVVFDFSELEAALECAQRIVQRSVRPAAARIVATDEGRFRLALAVYAASEALASAADAIVSSAASTARGERKLLESPIAEGGRFDRVVEVTQRWSRAASTYQALVRAGAREVWVDFLAPEAVTLVARIDSNEERHALVDVSVAEGGRIVAGLRSASPLDAESFVRPTGETWRDSLPPEAGRSGPYDDVLERLTADLDPRGVFAARAGPEN